MDKARNENSHSKIFDIKSRSISRELTVSLILLIILFEGFLLMFVYTRQARFSLKELNKKADDYAVNIGKVLAVPIWDYDDEQISKIGTGYVQNEVIDELHITNQHDKTLFKLRKNKATENRIERSIDVVYKEQIIGRVKLFLSLDAYKMDLARLRNAILLILVGSLIIILITTGVLLRVFMRKPLSILQKGIDRVAKGDYAYKFEEIHHKELSEIANRFNEMAFEIRAREASLHAMNKELQQEIIERKQAEQDKKKFEIQLRQAHKMEAIGTLTGGIAHDFNNILGIIIGNTELALDDIPEWSPAHLNLEEIRKASLRAKDVVRQLLSFSRQTDQERKPIKLVPVIQDAIKLLRVTIPMSVDIRQNIDDTSDTIFADLTQIHQLMLNLCTNAAHAMEDTGGILEIGIKNVVLDEVSAALYPDLTTGEYVKLTISDTGPGINPEIRNRIFDPYFTTKDVGKGTGMGLSVVHGIVKSHGGVIIIDSELERGTTVSIFFQVVEKEAVEEIETEEELPVGNERILFVDDEASMVYVGRYRLERLGYKIEAKTSPVEALEAFNANPDQFDLVITDMSMPQMTGDQLVKEILKTRPDMPTILCTGFSEKIDEDKAKEIGIRQYIEKPINRRDLAFMVRKVLDEK
ncbi:MAG: response regulator [Desulfobacterales bacterium]|nr:response regulator [Desulfobacterales bacterium]